VEDDSKKPEAPEPKPSEEATAEAKAEEQPKADEQPKAQEPSESAAVSPDADEEAPTSKKEAVPPPVVHPPPGPPPPTPIRLLKSVGTVAAILVILGGITLIARFIGRDPSPSEAADPIDTSHLDDPPPPLSTVPTPFGIDDLDANAVFVPDDDTKDAAAEFRAFMKFDGGRHTGHRAHDAGPETDPE